MLVRFLSPFEEQPATQKEFYNRPNFLQSARIEDHQYGAGFHRGKLINTKGKRLVVPSRSDSGDFKVLLFPYETTNPMRGDKKEVDDAWKNHPNGAVMPETLWNRDCSHLTVKISGIQDEFFFSKGSDGRTRVSMKRSGKQVLSAR